MLKNLFWNFTLDNYSLWYETALTTKFKIVIDKSW